MGRTDSAQHRLSCEARNGFTALWPWPVFCPVRPERPFSPQYFRLFDRSCMWQGNGCSVTSFAPSLARSANRCLLPVAFSSGVLDASAVGAVVWVAGITGSPAHAAFAFACDGVWVTCDHGDCRFGKWLFWRVTDYSIQVKAGGRADPLISQPGSSAPRRRRDANCRAQQFRLPCELFELTAETSTGRC